MQKRLIGVLAVSLAFQGVVFVAPVPVNAVISDGANAVDLIGQYTDAGFCSQTPNYTTIRDDNAPNPYGFDGASSVALDSVNHRLFVVDRGNHRVLVFILDNNNDLVDLTPDFVLGQPDFSSNAASTTQSSTRDPDAVAYDAINNRLFVSQYAGAARVTVFDVASITNGENAVGVLGKPNFTTGTAADSQASLMGPGGLEYDGANDLLYVADSDGNRVYVFDVDVVSDGENAAYVLGQASFGVSVSAVTQAGMSSPRDVLLDQANNRLFVSNSQRVTIYNVAVIDNGEAAVNVLGQTTFTGSSIGNTQAGMNNPRGLAYDPTTSTLFVGMVRRVTTYNVSSIVDGEDAVNVIGQSDFTSTTTAITQSGVSGIRYLEIDTTNDVLYVTDANRVMTFDTSAISNGMNATYAIGQYTSSTVCSTRTADFTANTANNAGTLLYGLDNPHYFALDAVNHRLFVSDNTNQRVLVFNLTVGNALADRVPDFVLGQPDFISTAQSTTQSSTHFPTGLAYDPTGNRLFVAQSSSHRVSVFDVATIVNGENAVNVLGQANFTSSGAAVSQTSVRTPNGVVFDDANDMLYVSQTTSANRVSVFDLSDGITNNEPALTVLGQANFTAGTAATSQTGMSGPVNLALDAANERLFVAQFGNHRVTVYDLSDGVSLNEPAVHVLGQANFTAGSAATTQSGLNNPLGVGYDSENDRLFVVQSGANRVSVFDTDVIDDGETAVNVLGQSNFTTGTLANTQAGMNFPRGALYDPDNDLLFVSQGTGNRITVYDAEAVSGGGTTDPTLSNAVTLSRLKQGVSSNVTVSFVLQNAVSGTLTVTFPVGFTVTGAFTGGSCNGGTVGTFGFTSSTLTAVKSGCTAGTLTVSGATVTNPGAAGIYHVTWVNDDPGGGDVYIVDDDQVTVTGSVDPALTFNAGSQAAATACDGTFSGAGGTVALGSVTTADVTTSDVASVPHICTRVSTNAASGAVVTVRNTNGASGLVSTSVPADDIDSATSVLSAGAEGYGICVGSGGGDTGTDSTTPTGAAVTRSSPFDGTCAAGSHAVGGLTTTPQNLWTLSGPSQNAFGRIYVKAAISPTTAAHTDYTDTLTFIATGTY